MIQRRPMVGLALGLSATVMLAGCSGGRIAKAEDALLASPLVADYLWDSGYIKVFMVRGKGRAAARRIYCQLLLPYGIDDGSVFDSRYRYYREPRDCRGSSLPTTRGLTSFAAPTSTFAAMPVVE